MNFSDGLDVAYLESNLADAVTSVRNNLFSILFWSLNYIKLVGLVDFLGSLRVCKLCKFISLKANTFHSESGFLFQYLVKTMGVYRSVPTLLFSILSLTL